MKRAIIVGSDFTFRLVRSGSGRNMLGRSYEVHSEGSRSADQGTYSATPAFERVDHSVQAFGPFHATRLDRIKLTTLHTIFATFTEFRIDSSLISALRIKCVVRYLAYIRSMPDDTAAFAAATQCVRLSSFDFGVVDPLMDQTIFFILAQYDNCFVCRNPPTVPSAQGILG